MNCNFIYFKIRLIHVRIIREVSKKISIFHKEKKHFSMTFSRSRKLMRKNHFNSLYNFHRYLASKWLWVLYVPIDVKKQENITEKTFTSPLFITNSMEIIGLLLSHLIVWTFNRTIDNFFPYPNISKFLLLEAT